MVEGKQLSNVPEPEENPKDTVGEEDEAAVKLLSAMFEGNVLEIKPQLDYVSESGFAYPFVEQAIGVKGKEAISLLESLINRDIFKRYFFDRLLRCHQCKSLNIRPTTHCPKCGADNIARGRVLEHFVCKYVGLEDDFMVKGRYMCPKCEQELRTVGSNYQSLGVLR